MAYRMGLTGAIEVQTKALPSVLPSDIYKRKTQSSETLHAPIKIADDTKKHPFTRPRTYAYEIPIVASHPFGGTWLTAPFHSALLPRTGPCACCFSAMRPPIILHDYYPMLAKALGREAIYFDYVTSVEEALGNADYLNRFDALLLRQSWRTP